MPRSLSKSQIDKLGERLAKESPAREEDLTLLGALRAEYLAPLLEVVAQVREHVGVEPSYRLKTNATIIEKLRRARTRLSSMQDVGGLRVVVAGTLVDQDRIVGQIAELFQRTKIEDRRARPSAGYRAVHLIIERDGFPIEIQIRTVLQDFWAQMFERLADRVGRGIRYGEPPTMRTAPANDRARHIVAAMGYLSISIGGTEEVRAQLLRMGDDLSPEFKELKRRVEHNEAQIVSMIEEEVSVALESLRE